MKPAVFFDRDGVLNKDVEYAFRPDQIEWVAGAIDAVRLANEAGYLVFVVTNQSGVARGFYTEENVNVLHRWMQAEMAAKGARIDAFAYCPHHPEGEGAYKITCACRKPQPGMLLDLMARHAVDKDKSFLIGDRDTDLQAAHAAGIRGCLYTGGSLAEFVAPLLS